MSRKTAIPLTPRQRLSRGLSHTATGPVDVTRGVVGLGAASARSGAAQLRQRYRDSRLAREVAAAPELVAKELSAVQEVVAALPQALQEARQSRRRHLRPLIISGLAVVLLAGGAAAAVVARRSTQHDEPSPRPPSVDVQPKP